MTAPHLVSPHFSLDEVERSATAHALGIDNTVPSDLLDNLERIAALMEQVRTLLGVPLRVTSWYRCPALNRAVGGVAQSAHLACLAVDFQPIGPPLSVAFDRIAASPLPFDQLIVERTHDGAQWIHLGLRDGPARREVLRASGQRLGGPMQYARARALAG